MRRKQIESDEPTEDNQPKLYLGNKQPRVTGENGTKRGPNTFTEPGPTLEPWENDSVNNGLDHKGRLGFNNQRSDTLGANSLSTRW
jgi:hypothetical protein